jgi:hypothetical protein
MRKKLANRIKNCIEDDPLFYILMGILIPFDILWLVFYYSKKH